ncbi:YIP1 family protein [Methanoplanus sp. FWC-SCC4]|uniref:YIP1 family protein n=1 Tax=Methanochimaera problematica TaxID=2609417 RepID=A0AA97FEU5_9EURY|nr:Yip1 family protein [Methanoplanus sp. FWC-SCC4]WOF16909.1 YIP1 family protein [Methanoplanus sp. FWC-SCC4]
MIPVKDILLSPKNFFESFCKQEDSLKAPIVIILILAVIASLTAVISASITGAFLPPEAEFMKPVISVITFAVTIIMTFILWVIFAAIFHGISALFKGTGSFNKTLAITSYGYIPQIISGLITSVLTYMHISSITVVPTTNPEQIQAYVEMISSGPMITAISVISIVFLLWSANIWLFGIKECRKISMRDAAITVGVPVILYILFILGTLLM